MQHTATYSPEDNKLRLYPAHRLDTEEYNKVKAAGFKWAPRQELFVAPMWTPQREDLLIEMCGEIGDEDTSLVDRAEERAERFQEYSDHRAQDADRAHDAVSAIADGIPMGQPILVGHHSERRARRDAEKIENGMRRAVKMWETSQYWKARAAGAIRAAKYKELPAVRSRRIKGLESDIRVYRAKFTPDPKTRPQIWDGEEVVWCAPAAGSRGGYWVKRSALPAIERTYTRWIQHTEHRLEYERAMLEEGGGIKADQFDIQVGGRVFDGAKWHVVTRLNHAGGRLNSVSVIGYWRGSLPIEDVRDYQPPQEGDAEKVAAKTKLAPICNFRSDGCLEMTAAEWKDHQRHSDCYFLKTAAATETTAPYRYRVTYRGGNLKDVFLTDAKVKEPPKIEAKPEPITFDQPATPAAVRQYQAPEPTKFDALKDTLAAGVKVVTAPQLFPTPLDLAARMVNIGDVRPGHEVLEPSAGTGNILKAIKGRFTGFDVPITTAVEVSISLADQLRLNCPGSRIECADFMECNGNLGKFDRIIMNPPFENGSDIKHIKHALTFLKPGGRLVAICAGGPRQEEVLRPLATTWERLPADTFKAAGTSVNTVLLSIDAEAQ